MSLTVFTVSVQFATVRYFPVPHVMQVDDVGDRSAELLQFLRGRAPQRGGERVLL